MSVLLSLVFLCFPLSSVSVNVDGCNIISNSPNVVGTPYFEDQPRHSVYGCLSSRSNDNYYVHVIGVYEGSPHHSFWHQPTSTSNVCFNLSESVLDKPLILVFTTYEPIQWILHIPEGIIINKVILCSYQNTSVIFPRAQVIEVEKGPRLTGYGSDSGSRSTERLLQYLSSIYGPVSSFTGTYTANKWILNIPRTFTNTSIRQDPQTCDTTVNVDGCGVTSNSPSALGRPIFGYRMYSIYSCLSTKNNSNYSIHVISAYEAGWFHTIASPLSRNSNVILNVTGSFPDNPLVLVLTTFAPTQWILHIPGGIVISKVILCSYHPSSVIFPRAQVLQVENGPRIYGFGSDTGRTERLLQYISSTLGPVTSFTGTFRANEWRLNIGQTPSHVGVPQGSTQTSVSTEDHTTTSEDLLTSLLGDDTTATQNDRTYTTTEYSQTAQNSTTEHLQISRQQDILISSVIVITITLGVFACAVITICMFALHRRNGSKANAKKIVQDPLYEEIKFTEDTFKIRDNQCCGSRLAEIEP